jgi:hypothetical protein
MPNYVYSTITLMGSEGDIEEFKERFMENKKIVATKIIPYPKDLALLDKVNKGYLEDNEERYKPTEEEKRTLMLMGLDGKYDITKDGYNQGGYEWCNNNWGSKWGFCNCEIIEDNEENLIVRFETAWSPIVPLITKISELLPNLRVEYSGEEESGDFAFDSTFEGGEMIEQIDRTDEYQRQIQEQEEEHLKEVEN